MARITTLSMANGQPWWSSKTIWGAIAVLITIVARVFVPDITEAEVGNIITMIVEAIAAIFAIFGRVKAVDVVNPTISGKRV